MSAHRRLVLAALAVILGIVFSFRKGEVSRK